MEYPIIHEMEQGGEDWLSIRCGKMTSSRFGTVLAKGSGKTRRDYMDAICSERKTGLPSASFSNSSMAWGTEHEDEAVAEYEKDQKVVVRRVGFVEMSDWLGGSPDGLVDDDGTIEVKCPDSKTHYRYIRMIEKDPAWYDPKYKWQMQGNMWVAGRKWCDWISFDPRYKLPKERLLIVRIPLDYAAVAELQLKCELFKNEALAEIRQSNPF